MTRNRRILRSLLLALLALIPVALAFRISVMAAGPDQTKVAAIDAFVSAYQEAQTFNGAVLVAEKGSVIFKKGFGSANQEWSIPNAADTKFRIGSMTKAFTSMLVLQLVQEKKIDLQAKLSAYLPFYRKDVGDKVTIHHLLTHTSGIPSYTDDMKRMEEAVLDPYPPAEFVTNYCSGDLQFEPGSRFRYDNSGYFILGAVIEAVAGKPYVEVLKERILVPLGMRDTGYDRPLPVLPKRAAGYSVTFDGLENARYINMSLPYAAGAIYSTVEDLFLWDRALAGTTLLPVEAKAVLFKPYVAMGGGACYAYGWIVGQRPVPGSQAKTPRIFHGGAIFGFGSYIERLPEEGHCVIILTNTPEANLPDMANGIIDILYGGTPARPKRSITRPVYEALIAKGPEEALRRYGEIKGAGADAYDIAPGELNQLGYFLLNTKKMTAEAIAIFKLNVAEFPKYANGYDSLGEAYLAAGDKAQAILNYRKSLELDPSNANAAAKLGEITK